MIGSPSRHASEGASTSLDIRILPSAFTLDIEEAIEGYLKAERIELTRRKP